MFSGAATDRRREEGLCRGAGACAETDTCVPKAAAIAAMKQVLVTIVRISPSSKNESGYALAMTDDPGRMF